MISRLLVFGVIFGMLSLQSHAEERQETELLCGVRCLYMGLLAMEIDPGRFADFIEKCGVADARGYSVGRLEEIARQHGAETLLVKTTIDNLRLRPTPFVCIAHVDGNHFVIIGDVDDSEVWIVDPPREGGIAKELFVKRWDGTALLLSRSPLASEESLARWPWAKMAWVAGIGLVLAAGWSIWKRKAVPV